MHSLPRIFLVCSLLSFAACEVEDDTTATDTPTDDITTDDTTTDDTTTDDTTGDDTTDTTTGVTYDDVSPILDQHCTRCHGSTPSNGAPTSFASYDDASAAIARIIRRGVDGDPTPMPPGGLTFTDDDVEILLDWQADGTPE